MKIFLKYIVLFCLMTIFNIFQSKAQQQITLSEAIETSLKNNLDIQVSKNNVIINSINNYIGVAGGLPTVLGSGGTTEQVIGLNQHLSTGTITDRPGVVSNSSNIGVTASMLLYNGGRVWATRNRLSELQHLSQQQLNSTIQNAIADVMLKYYNVIQQQNFVSTLSQSIEVSKQKLALIQAKRSVGLLSDSDLLQAQIDLNAEMQALQAQNIVIEQSKNDLLRSMVLAPNTNIIIKDTILVDRDVSWENIEANLKKNPTLLAADVQININKIIEREVNTKRFPTVSANTGYNYSFSKSSAGLTLLNQNYGPFLGLTLNVPIYVGTVNIRQVQVAKVNTENARVQKEIVYQNFQNVASKSWETYVSSLKLIETERQNYLLTQKLLNLITLQFQLGQATIIDVRVAQQSFENSGYRLNNLNYTAKVAEITLKQIANLLGN